MQQRQKFIDEYVMQEESVAELARRFEISRKTRTSGSTGSSAVAS